MFNCVKAQGSFYEIFEIGYDKKYFSEEYFCIEIGFLKRIDNVCDTFPSYGLLTSH